MTTTIELFRQNDAILKSLETATLSEFGMIIEGHDSGPFVKEMFGVSDEYEYRFRFDKTNTIKLFMTLGIENLDDKEKLE